MSFELLAFANFGFKVQTVSSKVIIGGRIKVEERFRINWEEFQQSLERSHGTPEGNSSGIFNRYGQPRIDPHLLETIIDLQREVREILDDIGLRKKISIQAWKKIFTESNRLVEILVPDRTIDREIGEMELKTISFQKQISAETLRSLLYGQIRDLIVLKKVFRLKKCPECGVYFFDETKNGKKVYCSSSTCGNRAKQRAFQARRKKRGGD